MENLKEIPGRGISAVVEGRQVCAGNRMMMEELGFSPEEVQAGGTVVYAAVDGSYAGCILLEDTVKPGAREALAELRALGVRETVMLTGDREHAAASVAQRLGLTRWFAGLLPQDKVEKVRELQESKDTLIFVGDGVNDAPVLAMAGVGVAMGGIGSDAAVEAADLVLLKDDLPESAQGHPHLPEDHGCGPAEHHLCPGSEVCRTAPQHPGDGQHVAGSLCGCGGGGSGHLKRHQSRALTVSFQGSLIYKRLGIRHDFDGRGRLKTLC